MFIQTRGNDKKTQEKVSFSEALLNPSASFGGLYVPEILPKIDLNWLEEHKNTSYKKLCLDILSLFDLDVDKKVLEEAINLYDKFDDKNNPVPLKKIEENLYVNELYHGATRAFKDMALQPFGYILSHLAKKKKENFLILAATSGDTGPATLETFKNKENIKVVCLYPEGGTSDVQKLQMVTNGAKNIKVLGIKGNFDDAQRALKTLLNSTSFKDELQKQNIKLSAANSVNFGRIIFQIIYHVSAYLKLLQNKTIQNGEKIYLTIPSGNFGNALGAYYAKKMGLPVEKILIASNINNILTELINTGIYDIRDKKLLLTTSPAMDILISSNVERMLFDKFGYARCRQLMDSLQANAYYKLNEDEIKQIQDDFSATYCDDEYAKKTIKKYAQKGYVLDPHTATCLKARESEEKPLQNVIASTAEWTKFAPTMLNAINEDDKKYDDKTALKGIKESLNVKIPNCINKLFNSKVAHNQVVEKENIEENIIKFLKA
ncbi:MAG: threonine synthase [Proteobacteria bacterium]|nr:MAG: threonine synthase [Pseudomonadota bacterium]